MFSAVADRAGIAASETVCHVTSLQLQRSPFSGNSSKLFFFAFISFLTISGFGSFVHRVEWFTGLAVVCIGVAGGGGTLFLPQKLETF